MIVDHSTDYLCWDNVEQVTLNLARTNPTSITIPVAMNDALDRKTANELGLGLDQQGIRWHIPDIFVNPPVVIDGIQQQLFDVEIIKNDTVADGFGNVYTVIDSHFSEEMRHWTLACVPQR